MRIDGIHRCVYNTGRDGIEANTLIRKLDCERPSDRLQSTLGEVRKACWQYPDRLAYKGCRNVDHMSGFLKTHFCHCELRDVKESGQVRSNRSLEVFRSIFGKRLRDKNT